MSNFVLKWPHPIRVLREFGKAGPGAEIAAAAGTPIVAGVMGVVTGVTESTVTIRAGNHIVEFGNLTNVAVQDDQPVDTTDKLGESRGPEGITITVSELVNPAEVLVESQPKQPEPVKPEDPAIPYVTPTEDGIRLRQKPVNGFPMGLMNAGDPLEVLEDPQGVADKLGKSDEWINVRTEDGRVGYMSAAYLKAYEGKVEPLKPSKPVKPVKPGENPLGAPNITGMNLDIYNPLGRPSPEDLSGVGWIRVKFNVSFNPDNHTYGNTDIDATFRRMRDFLQPYADAGLKVLMVFTHQLYGEGAGFNWPTMTSVDWDRLIPKFADFAKQTAAKFKDTGLVQVYQIWNEQDTDPRHARAAVPISAGDYAKMLTATIRAIDSVDPDARIITGGHVGGPDAGGQYARATLAAMPDDVRPDGIAFHPYGRGSAGHRFSVWGSIAESIRKYGQILDAPLWITEWGVLDHQGNDGVAEDVSDYATRFLNILKKQYPDKVAAAIWYAWADGMDNGYGLVRQDGKPRDPLFTAFKKA